mmetsp:Transcript_15713/g.27910  ORF Transcript_15713/g.27910 Transcript_15713/m.27910 type:complete len:378 (+) Transcript_15713:60-1193(+)
MMPSRPRDNTVFFAALLPFRWKTHCFAVPPCGAHHKRSVSSGQIRHACHGAAGACQSAQAPPAMPRRFPGRGPRPERRAERGAPLLSQRALALSGSGMPSRTGFWALRALLGGVRGLLLRLGFGSGLCEVQSGSSLPSPSSSVSAMMLGDSAWGDIGARTFLGDGERATQMLMRLIDRFGSWPSWDSASARRASSAAEGWPSISSSSSISSASSSTSAECPGEVSPKAWSKAAAMAPAHILPTAVFESPGVPGREEALPLEGLPPERIITSASLWSGFPSPSSSSEPCPRRVVGRPSSSKLATELVRGRARRPPVLGRPPEVGGLSVPPAVGAGDRAIAISDTSPPPREDGRGLWPFNGSRRSVESGRRGRRHSGLV